MLKMSINFLDINTTSFSRSYHLTKVLSTFLNVYTPLVDILLAIANRHLLAVVYSINTMPIKTKPEKINVELAAAFRKKRNRLRKSQEEIAYKAEIDRSYFSEIECGKVSVSIPVAHRIAKALNTSLSRIIKEVEKKL